MSKHTVSESSTDYGNWSPELEIENQVIEPDVASAPVVKTPIDYSLVNHAFVVASREPGVQYEIGQAGEKEFTYNDVLFICYRLEVPLSDAEIKAYVRKSVRAGILAKGTTRNRFQMSHLMRQTHDDLMAEFREIQARRNPTQR